MTVEYLTDEERNIKKEIERANTLKRLILGKGDDGPLSAISELLGDKLQTITGKNERIVSVDDMVDYLVQSRLADSPNEARYKVLPEMKNRTMNYKVTADLSYSMRITEVEDEEGRKSYRVSRFIG